MPGTPSPRRWLFLGVLVDVLTEPGAPVTVAEAVLPEGASPPAHLHAALDDSFYILDGRMVLHCGDDVWQAGPGSWVQFPAGVPHTFRVLGAGPGPDGPRRRQLPGRGARDRPPGHRYRRPGRHAWPHHRGTGPGVRRARHHQCRPANGTARGRAPPRRHGMMRTWLCS